MERKNDWLTVSVILNHESWASCYFECLLFDHRCSSLQTSKFGQHVFLLLHHPITSCLQYPSASQQCHTSVTLKRLTGISKLRFSLPSLGVFCGFSTAFAHLLLYHKSVFRKDEWLISCDGLFHKGLVQYNGNTNTRLNRIVADNREDKNVKKIISSSWQQFKCIGVVQSVCHCHCVLFSLYSVLSLLISRIST